MCYLLCPTPSHSGQLTLVHCFGARVIPRRNVLPRIIPIVSLLVISTSPGGRACFGRMSIFDIKTTRKTHIPICITFGDVGVHWCRIALHALLCEWCHAATASAFSTNGGQATLSTASDKIGKWGAYVASARGRKICTTTASAASTFTASTLFCREHCKIWD